MPVFFIDSSNELKVYASIGEARRSRDGTLFTNERQFASVASDWPMARLTGVWNKIPGAKPVRKFTDRRTALRRLWAAFEARKPKPVRGAKAEMILKLLDRPTGATIQELMAATGWQAHSVRAFLSAQVPKKLGLVAAAFERDGRRAYRLSRRRQ